MSNAEYEALMQEDRTGVSNDHITIWEAMLLFGSDLPELADRINAEASEAESLF